MAGPPKKKLLQNPDDATQSDSENETDSESYHGQEEIQADFEGRNPEGQDFHGIKQLLRQLFLKAHVNISEMSDLLIAQTGIGSVLKQSTYEEDEDDEDDNMTEALDVFGITSILNLSNKKSDCLEEFKSLLRELSSKHAPENIDSEISNILSSGDKLGLIINERFVNIPPKISDPLFTSLLGEVERIKKKDPSYDFKYLIMICKLHKTKNNSGEVIFSNAEEEIFDKESQIKFEFSVEDDSDSSVSGKWSEGDVKMTPYRKVLILQANKLPNIVEKVKNFVN